MSELPLLAAAHRILYDANCGFCRWSLGWVLRCDGARRLRPVALQEAEAEWLLAGMSESERMAAWHLVDPGGSVHSAGRAVPPLLALLLPGAMPAGLARRLQGPIDRAYGWVAGNRGALGQRLRHQALARADELIAARRLQRPPRKRGQPPIR
ncbi:MAG: DUF393 domain-containing protein [Thermoleophilaceae bacterium]|nr:DUF393 domain-containing protein [Thermoleophilaceae bacterium]